MSVSQSMPDQAISEPAAQSFYRGVASLKVSILMCAFNERERIQQAIYEVLQTSYPCDMNS